MNSVFKARARLAAKRDASGARPSGERGAKRRSVGPSGAVASLARPNATVAKHDISQEGKQDAETAEFCRVLQTGAPPAVGAQMQGPNCVELEWRQPNFACDHQRKFVQWFVGRAARSTAEQPFRSATMCHDPGLGKTVTAALLFAALSIWKRNPSFRCIVTAFKSTLSQWTDTFKKWTTTPSSRVVSPRSLADLRAFAATSDAVDAPRVVVATHDLLSRAWRATHELRSREESALGDNPEKHWVLVNEGDPLHRLFEMGAGPAQLLIVDEVHVCRNGDRDKSKCAAHEALAAACDFAVGLSGTLIMNSPTDMQGICRALATPAMHLPRPTSDGKGELVDFTDPLSWQSKGKLGSVRVDVVRFYAEKLMHRALESNLKLPPMFREAVSFPVELSAEHAEIYNETLTVARELRVLVNAAHNANRRDDSVRLLQMIHFLQQFIVSPVLATHGAEALVQDADLMDEAAREARTAPRTARTAPRTARASTRGLPSSQGSGLLRAVAHEVVAFERAGRRRVVVASPYVAMLRILHRYMSLRPEFDGIFEQYLYFTGRENDAARAHNKAAFLQCRSGILFLSSGAGGTGLDLVPGCSAMVTYGAMEYSPNSLWQLTKRIHRIGQDKDVHIKHLVPYGSVDFAIAKLHEDKKGLARLVQDGDDSYMSTTAPEQWKRSGRICESCLFISENGNFPDPPKALPWEAPFSVMDGLTTRFLSFESSLSSVPPR
jgi:hypothetical protein